MPRILRRTRRLRLVCACLLVAGAQLGAAPPLRAQPWSPPKGEGTVSLTYQNYYVTGHYDLLGLENTNGATHTKSLAAEVDVGLTDTVGLSVSVPFIASKYTGPPFYVVAGELVIPGPLDDGTYHGALQDFRLEIRRPFQTRSVAVAPFVGVSIPSHAYQTEGEAVPGRRRPEVLFGVSAGVPLDEVLRGLYAEIRYGIGATPPLQGFSAVRSTVNLEAGCAVATRLAFRGMFGWQFRLKGPLAPQLASEWDADRFQAEHDRFIIGNYFNAGAGTTISVTRSIDLDAVWVATLAGKNGAHVSRLFAVGATWSFGGGFGVW